jgi:hypothetical protein
MKGKVAIATFSAGTPIRIPIVRGLLWRDLRMLRVGLPRYPIFAARLWTCARVSALIAGWFARLLDTVVLESLSRSAIACWFTEELILGEGLEVSNVGANPRRAVRATLSSAMEAQDSAF